MQINVSIHLMLFFITIGSFRRNVLFWCFNTSHVILYLWPLPCRQRICCVSIHLMLFFIFNIPHVPHCITIVSIHLMLFFIDHAVRFKIEKIDVSIHLMLFFIVWTVLSVVVWLVFQYISCYSLSQCTPDRRQSNHVSIHLMLFFINGASPTGFISTSVSIHLMLFFIDKLDVCFNFSSSFNTSHVILYL